MKNAAIPTIKGPLLTGISAGFAGACLAVHHRGGQENAGYNDPPTLYPAFLSQVAAPKRTPMPLRELPVYGFGVAPVACDESYDPSGPVSTKGFLKVPAIGRTFGRNRPDGGSGDSPGEEPDVDAMDPELTPLPLD